MSANPSSSRPVAASRLRRTSRWVTVLVLFVGAALQSSSASAQRDPGSGTATPTGTGGVVEAIRLTEGGEGSGGSGSGGGAEPLPCFSSITTAEIARQLVLDPSIVHDGEQWVAVTCYSPGSVGASWLAAVYRVGDPAGLVQLLERAIDRLVVPEPVTALMPGPDRPHLVGLPEYLAVGADTWHAHTASAAIPGLSVTLTAEPLETRWDMGNGAQVTCPGPGTPWQSGLEPAAACTYTYQWSSTATQPGGLYHVVASTIWSRTWQCQPGCGSGTLPDLSRSTAIDLQVMQGQAVITRPPT